MTLGEWLTQARRRLADAGIASPALEAQMLAGHILRVDRAFVLTHPEHEFPELAGEQVLQRRERQEPLAYILGWREFYGRRFEVGPGVLIPRQETETLVETALAFLTSHTKPRVLDLGTGSGCIAITLKLENTEAAVTGIDLSEAALETAIRNAADLGADVRFLLSDTFRGLSEETFNLIVSNPPYVGLSEQLPPEVRNFEPALALFSGSSGLEFYEALARDAAEFLSEDGRLMMEVGYRQANEVSLIFESSGWHVLEVRQDLSGVDRVVVVEPLNV